MKKLYLIIFLSLLVINMQCGNGGERSIPVNTPVSITVTEAVEDRNLYNNLVNGELDNNVSGVVAESSPGARQLSMCRFTITGPGMEDIVREVDVAGKTSIKETFNVPSGLNRSFLIQMFVGNSDMVLYQAQDDENLEGDPVELKMELKETSEYSKAPEFYGIKSVSNSATRSVMLNWEPAIDNITAQERIQYRVFLTTKSKRDKADENDIMSVYTVGNSTNRDNDPLMTYEYAGDELILISYEYEGALPENEQTSSDRLEPGVPYSFVVRARDEWGFEEENVEETGQIIVHWLDAAVQGSGTVTSAPEGINCREIGGTCSEDFLVGIPVALTAKADEGSQFEGWTGYEQCNEADQCVVTPADDLPLITANFCSLTRYYMDSDKDGYGATDNYVDSCNPVSNHVTDGTDCDDSNPSINAAAEEVCGNDIDENCDGVVTGCTVDCTDGDGDLYGIGEDCLGSDCDDDNASINPGAAEVCNDSIDNDCDGSVDNADTDCQACQPGAAQNCSTGLNGICSAGTETCGDDGFWGSCVQNNQPAAENCSDSLDNDCDGSVDNADTDCQECQPGAAQNCSTGLNGICSAGTETCGNDGFWGSCLQNNQPAAENCSDSLDNDCDGSVDNADTDCQECQPGAAQNCSTGLNGICSAGTETCGNDGFWGSCLQNNQPAAENCSDSLDNDCDGSVDNADTDCQECQPGAAQNCSTGLNGICSAGTETCGNDGFWGSCLQNNQPAAENCSDSLDNDCDGSVDNADTDCQECQPGAAQNCSTGLNGICSAGTETCGNDGFWGSCIQNVQSTSEVCDGLDNDCDGSTDEGCDDDNDNYCDSNMTTIGSPPTCTNGGGDCADTNKSINPGAAEVCPDNIDNDCDGLLDFADSGECPADITKGWDMTYDWGCDGSSLRTKWFINADGTVGPNEKATWTTSGYQVTISYYNGGTTYIGTVNSTLNYMSGTMTSSSSSGCWHAYEEYIVQ